MFLTRGGYFSTKSNLLYRNDGFGNFVRVREGVIATDQNSSNGAAWGDYDRDGDLDLFVSNVLNLNENNALYRNNGNANNWINIKCIGVVSNKSAIGAKVRLKARIGNESRWQLRHISGQTGKCAQNSLNVHFGLGDATIIDSIKIEWPSGKLTVQENISVNQFITIIEEGSTKVAKIIPNASVINTYPNPFIDSITIEYKVNEYSQVTLNIFDLLGKEVKTLINSYESPGTKTQVWDGTNNSGNKLQPGTYQILMQINGVITTKQLILVR
ncbi:ASPIC/UnbV domain-containing protein [Bacteroidota bacterium]